MLMLELFMGGLYDKKVRIMNNEWQERENQHRDAMLEAAHKWDNRTEYEWDEAQQKYIHTKSQSLEMQVKDYCLLAGLIVLVIILALLPPL
jgi:hypothetical protein